MYAPLTLRGSVNALNRPVQFPWCTPLNTEGCGGCLMLWCSPFRCLIRQKFWFYNSLVIEWFHSWSVCVWTGFYSSGTCVCLGWISPVTRHVIRPQCTMGNGVRHVKQSEGGSVFSDSDWKRYIWSCSHWSLTVFTEPLLTINVQWNL